MTVKLTSYIACNGNAQAAMGFYQSIFGGEIYSDTFGEFVAKNPDSGMPIDEADTDKVMHAYLKGDNGIELMAADVPNSIPYRDGARLSLTLSGDDDTLLRGYWDKLAAGGVVTAPLTASPWGDTFGILSDKFGVDWMVNIGPVQGE